MVNRQRIDGNYAISTTSLNQDIEKLKTRAT